MEKSRPISQAKSAATAALALAVLTATVSLTGCAPDKHVTEVKALAFSYPDTNVQDPNLTVDQALDYRKVCDSVKWKVDQTEQHQTFVEYRCDYKGIGDSLFVERDTSGVASAGDVYQWTYGSDGEPALSYVGFVIHYKNGTAKDFKLDATHVMALASGNRATNFDEAFSYLIHARIPVKPAMPFTETTYGNTLVTYYPGRSVREAARLAYDWKRVDVDVGLVDGLGYVPITVEDVNQLFPVNPADVQWAKKIDPSWGINSAWDLTSTNPAVLVKRLPLSPNKLFCLSQACYDSNANPVGRAPESVLAQEAVLGKWVQISATASAPTSAKEAADAPDALAAAMASTAATPPAPTATPAAPAAQVTQAARPMQVAPTPATPITPQGQPIANATVHSGDVGPDGWPKMTPCIQKLQDKFTVDQQKQNADTSTSLEQMQEWADVCKSLGQ